MLTTSASSLHHFFFLVLSLSLCLRASVLIVSVPWRMFTLPFSTVSLYFKVSCFLFQTNTHILSWGAWQNWCKQNIPILLSTSCCPSVKPWVLNFPGIMGFFSLSNSISPLSFLQCISLPLTYTNLWLIFSTQPVIILQHAMPSPEGQCVRDFKTSLVHQIRLCLFGLILTCSQVLLKYMPFSFSVLKRGFRPCYFILSILWWHGLVGECVLDYPVRWAALSWTIWVLL